jgi:hypothetical protein
MKMAYLRGLPLLLTLAIVMGSATVGHGTAIVAYLTPDVIVVAADSRRTYLPGGAQKLPSTTCKLFDVRGAVFASSGFGGDLKSGFDVTKDVAKILCGRRSVPDAVGRIRQLLEDSLARELQRIKDAHPTRCSLLKDLDSCGTTVIIATVETGVPTMHSIEFVTIEDNNGNVTVDSSSETCPGDCQSKRNLYFLGEQKAIKRYLGGHMESFKKMSPEKGTPFLVKKEIDAKTPGVGGPVDVVRISSKGVEWLIRKKECSGAPKGFRCD